MEAACGVAPGQHARVNEGAEFSSRALACAAIGLVVKILLHNGELISGHPCHNGDVSGQIAVIHADVP